jgi:hypothetical protein
VANQCTQGHVVAPHKWFCNCGEPTVLYLERAATPVESDIAGDPVASEGSVGSVATLAPPEAGEERSSGGVAVRAASGFGKLLVGVVLTVLLAFGASKGYAFVNDYVDTQGVDRVEAYLTGEEGAPYVASDLRFRAVFPKAPSREERTEEVLGMSIPTTMYAADLGSSAYLIGGYEMTPDAPFDLNAAVNGAAAAVNGTVQSAQPISFVGVDAVEATITIDDPQATIMVLVFRIPERAYILQVISEDDPGPGYDEFKASFSLL